MSSLKLKITGQYLYSLISRAIMIGLKVIFSFFLIHKLQEDVYGFYGVTVAILGIWVSVVDLGWGDYMSREIPVLNPESQKQMLKSASTVHFIWNFLLLIAGVCLYKSGLFTSLHRFIPNHHFLILCGILFTLAGYFPIIQIYLNYSKSIEDFNQITLLQMIVWMISLGIVSLIKPVGISTIILTWCFSYLCTYGFFMIRYRFFFVGKVSKGFLSKGLKFGFPLCVLGTGQEFLQNYDRYLLGTFTSFSEVAPYHLFNNIIDVAERANQITLNPYIFQAHDENQLIRRNRLITSLLKTRVLLQLLGILGGGLVIFSVPFLLPPYYRSGLPLFLLIGFTSIIRSPAKTLHISFMLEKKTYLLALSNALGLLVSIPLNLKLIPLYHAYGAAISLWVSTLVTLVFQFSVIKVWKYLDFAYFFSWDMEKKLLKDWLARKKNSGEPLKPEGTA
ncbi:MAG: lipopolysaccharide biosynthesis protein [Candidatus Omnitrophica bacterium]|nr:lipopolysaccharide biosynthesis protein [Candidatus Omnitrophota bacterium]